MDSNIFFAYGAVVIAEIIYNFVKYKKSTTTEIININASNLQQHIKPDLIFTILGIVWKITGFFTKQAWLFLTLFIISVAFPFILNNEVNNTSKKDKLFTAYCFIKIIIVVCIICAHFKN